MKITLKEFLKEQAAKGIDVPKIFEDMSFGPNGQINDDAEPQDFEFWDDTDISGPAMQMLITNTIDSTIELIKHEVTQKFGKPNPKVEHEMAKMIAELWCNTINDNLPKLQKFNEASSEHVEEGFFNNLKNKFTGAIEFNTNNSYTGSAEAQDFVTKDRRSKVQIDTLVKKGMTPEEAKAAVMYVFDKSGNGALGFMGKKTDYDPQTKTLKVTSSGGMNPNLAA